MPHWPAAFIYAVILNVFLFRSKLFRRYGNQDVKKPSQRDFAPPVK
jgi:hypothetical protein